MPKLIPDFLKRIQENAFNEVNKRFAPTDDQAAGVTKPTDGSKPGLIDRAKQVVKDKVETSTPYLKQMLDPSLPLTPALIKSRIRYAGQNHLEILLGYNNTVRLVEPYSYRARGVVHQIGKDTQLDPNNHFMLKSKKGALLFYGWCSIHEKIHAFSLDKISSLVVTDKVYKNRWTVEL